MLEKTRNSSRGHLLVVDDDAGHRIMLKTLLQEWGYTISLAQDGEEAIQCCREDHFDVILMDVRMPKKSGIEALHEIKVLQPHIPVLIMTAFSDVEVAVQAIKSGAHDYLTKPLDFEKLDVTLKNIFAFVDLKEKNTVLSSALSQLTGEGSGNIIGKSRAMRQVMDMVTAIAPSEATVMITGESGTGKEVIAKALHTNSPRANGPYIAFNCAAITESLIESELFGHEKGAFTGADKRREGRFEQANGGTIFLDEIGEMPLLMQAKLLRVLQEREVQRVGGNKSFTVDVRVIAATNRNLLTEVRAGRFREDLFYRLNVVALHLPALYERTGDIPLLAQHFLLIFAAKNKKTLQGFSTKAMEALTAYMWPGNVRELENVVERAVVLAFGDYIDTRDLPPHIISQNTLNQNAPHHQHDTLFTTKNLGTTFAHASSMRSETKEEKMQSLEELEKQAVLDTLKECNNNKSETAKKLGISRKTLYIKLEKYLDT